MPESDDTGEIDAQMDAREDTPRLVRGGDFRTEFFICEAARAARSGFGADRGRHRRRDRRPVAGRGTEHLRGAQPVGA